jgi:hypothetical protein
MAIERSDFYSDSRLDTSNKVGLFESMLAGVGSGLLAIPKGLFSLGATLLDLGVNSGKAAEVEQWFDDLTTWDEKAEATAAGKITELLVNIGLPGGYGFKLGSKLAKQSMLAAKSGKYVKMSNPSLQKGVKKAMELNARGNTNRFIAGAVAGGVAEGVFVGDVEKIGSFGDLMGGPTKITRGDGEDAVRDLLNRVKFGTEGAMFTGVVGGIGSTIKRLANRNKKLDVANSKFDAFLDKFAGRLRARSFWTPEGFEIVRQSKGARGADTVYAKNVSREVDQIVDSAFSPMRTIFNKQTAKERDIMLKELNEILLSGDPKLVEKTIKGADGKLTKKMVTEWGGMDPGKMEVLAKKLTDLEVDADTVAELWGAFGRIRQRWGDLFTDLGGTLNQDELKSFKDLFGNKFKEYLGATYDVMQNKSILPWLRYKPTADSIKEVKEIFKKTYAEVHPGQVLDDLEAEQHVMSIIESAKLPKGMRMDVPSDPYFTIPKFFAGKTVMQDAAKGTRRLKRLDPNISDIVKEYRPAFERLLGKQYNPMQTILGATAKLSMLAQRNIFFRNIWTKNDELVNKAFKEIEATGATKVEPMFVHGTENAQKFFGDRKNWRRIDVIDEGQRGRVGMDSGASNPFTREADVYAKKGVADALEQQGFNNITPTLMGSEMLGQLYSGLILYPKATSQIAKTILAPVTHMRNFISAGAFAAANGIFPASFAKVPLTIGGKEIVENPMKIAYQALQTGLKGTRQQNELYEKLLKLGVVNTNVRIGDLSRLLKDVNFGETLTYQKGFRGLLKQISKIKQVGQDLYTAEDDFWKIFSWAMEKSRIAKAFEKQGLVRGNWFTPQGATKSIKLTEDYFEKRAADIVKNNIPNYDFVPDFIKGLRQLPIGNFVSFPAEIARTGTNIVQRALREISETITLANGTVVKPFQGIGYTRLFGFTTTVAAVPYATTKMFQALYDVTDDERDAIRRYVADWSKNSTILPMKDDDGNFKYIDFSHANAYDTLIRPLQSVINAVADGQSEDGIMDDFLVGMFTAMKEFGEPFISESIWTEAVTDLVMRGGRTRQGYQVYNKEDSGGNKAVAIFKHLVKAQMPFSVDQLKRLDRSIKPINFIVKGKYDKYGQEYEFGDEFAGLFGFRAVALNPERTIKFKVAGYKKGVRDSGSLFTRETLRGGPIESREIVEAFINSNRALFNVKKNFMKDLDAAKTLGISEDAYNRNVDISMAEKGALEEGVFRPYYPSSNIRAAFAENADRLGVADPFEGAADTIGSIYEQLTELSLDAPEFPTINNPLMPSIMDRRTIPNIETGALNLPSVDANLVGKGTIQNRGQVNAASMIPQFGGGNIPYNQLTTQQKLDILFGQG